MASKTLPINTYVYPDGVDGLFIKGSYVASLENPAIEFSTLNSSISLILNGTSGNVTVEWHDGTSDTYSLSSSTITKTGLGAPIQRNKIRFSDPSGGNLIDLRSNNITYARVFSEYLTAQTAPCINLYNNSINVPNFLAQLEQDFTATSTFLRLNLTSNSHTFSQLLASQIDTLTRIESKAGSVVYWNFCDCGDNIPGDGSAYSLAYSGAIKDALASGVGGSCSAYPYLPTTYSGETFSRVYSLRRFYSDSQYAVKIRRGSDDTTFDLGFDGYGNINLRVFRYLLQGADYGYVETIYDQSSEGIDLSGNLDANEPYLYDQYHEDWKTARLNNTSLPDPNTSTYINFVPYLFFDGSNDTLGLISGGTVSQPFEMIGVYDTGSGGSNGVIFGAGDSVSVLVSLQNSPVQIAVTAGTIVTESTDAHYGKNQISIVYNSTSSQIRINDTQIGSNVDIGTNSLSGFQIGSALFPTGSSWNFYEVLIVSSLSDSDRTNIWYDQQAKYSL